jgi:regulator of sigma D
MDKDMEHEEVKKELGGLMEITFRLEDELNMVIMKSAKQAQE